MAEGVSGEPQKISRRQFLRFLGVGAAAVGSAAVASACSKGPENSAELDKKELSFKKIENGNKIPLNINGAVSEVVIVYTGHAGEEDAGSLWIRQRGETSVAKSFEEGAETVRRLGEVTDSNLYEMKGKSLDLGEEITVGVYPTTNGNLIDGDWREDLKGTGLSALKVVVNGAATRNYEIDNPPLETNKDYHKNNWLSMPEFGQGLAIGRLTDGEMNKVFYVEGFICDERAVELNNAA